MTDTNKKTFYEAMFLLENQEVRKGFNAARDWVKTTLEKHGLQVKVLRLWGERKLAYPIGRRHRATFLLGWLEGEGEAVNAAKRDFYLLGPVFRVLFLQREAIPAEELAFGIEEVDESALDIGDDTPPTIEEELQESDVAPEQPSDDPDFDGDDSDMPIRRPAARPAVKTATPATATATEETAASGEKAGS
ncbi:MAG TPA: 30S ribosomal protein S6 [Planctomycetota bacterium]